MKSVLTLDGVPLGASGDSAWRFQTGAEPYVGTFHCHKSQWTGGLETAMRSRKELTLQVVDSRGTTLNIKRLSILHQLPSNSPNRRYFALADKRWLWSYKLVARDFNITRKTGDRTALKDIVPVEVATFGDVYDFMAYSLKDGKDRWTARDALESVLDIIHETDTVEDDDVRRKEWVVDRFPLKDADSRENNAISLQNVSLRDNANVAISRVLSYIPGCDIYVDHNGVTRVFDAMDLGATERYFTSRIPQSTWSGEVVRKVDRTSIRPSKVSVFFQKEIEVAFEYSDDYAATTTSIDPIAPWVENVIPTVDPETEIRTYDPFLNDYVTTTVPAGTWVEAKTWLAAMDADRPSTSEPWTFDTISTHWVHGSLDGALGASGAALVNDTGANIPARVAALKQHWRQTFRINRRYMERIRELMNVRVAVLDYVTGARAPSAAWGQYCISASNKGVWMASRVDPDKAQKYLNVDSLYLSTNSATNLIETPPSPVTVQLVDKELGIFRLTWVTHPWGTMEGIFPFHLVKEGDRRVPLSPVINLRDQDDYPLGVGMKVSGGVNGQEIRETMEMKVILTIVPAGPNDKSQFWEEKVPASSFDRSYRIPGRLNPGNGPALELYAQPGEGTSRWAWYLDTEARDTIQYMLGLREEDERAKKVRDQKRLELGDYPGFVHANGERELKPLATSIAAEAMVPFADNIQGAAATVMTDAPRLVGNMASTTVRIAGADSGKVDAVHEFPGQQRAISRFALMPESARHIILGTLPYKDAT